MSEGGGEPFLSFFKRGDKYVSGRNIRKGRPHHPDPSPPEAEEQDVCPVIPPFGTGGSEGKILRFDAGRTERKINKNFTSLKRYKL